MIRSSTCPSWQPDIPAQPAIVVASISYTTPGGTIVMRLSWYAARLRSGVMKGRCDHCIVVDAGAVAVLDGRDGMGQALTAAATKEAVMRAQSHGIAAVAVRNSNHFGTAMYFTKLAADDGCVAFLSTNSSPAMAPWGGRGKAVGANPWSWAAPAGRYAPMLLDTSNTAVARGKIYLARQKGPPIPLGWALDAEGRETTDPLAALGGTMMPMAGHKGYAMAAIADMLSGILSGSGFGTQVSGPYQADKPGRVGHLMIVLNIRAFQPLEEFSSRMEQLIDGLKSNPLAKGFEEIFYPGELQARNDEKNRSHGLLLPHDTVGDLKRLALEYGCEAELPIEWREHP